MFSSDYLKEYQNLRFTQIFGKFHEMQKNFSDQGLSQATKIMRQALMEVA